MSWTETISNFSLFQSDEEFHTALEKPLFKQYAFRLRAKAENYNVSGLDL